MKTIFAKFNEVIKLMQDGWEMYVEVYAPSNAGGYTSLRYRIKKDDFDSMRVHHRTFSALRDGGFIGGKPDYELTEGNYTILHA